MLRVIDCLTLYHDYWLVGVAALVCVLGCASTALVAERGMATGRTMLWGLLLGVSFGSTAWATHFVAMLAYRLSVPTTYAPAPTFLSLVLGLVVVSVGFALALQQRERLSSRLIGGAIVASGVLGLHYLGMSGLRFPGDLSYAPSLVAASIVLGLAFGMAGIGLMFSAGAPERRHMGALLLLLMTVSLHFVGMGAVELSLGLADPQAVRGLPRSVLVVGVVAAVLVVLAIGVAAALLDQRLTAHLTRMARHDALTDLPNRRYFGELFEDALESARREETTLSVYAIDLDDFKSVNDVHGHAAGDVFIRTVARRIAGLIREGDVFARLGGDEFALIEHCREGGDCSATSLAARVHEALAAPIRVGDTELKASASIGIARYPRDAQDMESLLSDADTAMYRAKSNGKGDTQHFDVSMNAEIEARRRLESRLRLALDNGSLRVFYQPLVASSDRYPVCCEALLRWDDEELGRVSPEDFIPVAESTGLIVPIGEFVLRQACRDAMRWPEAMRVAVNLSVVQFVREGLVDTVRDALQASGLAGKRLELEITESLLIDDRERTLVTLTRLRQLGVEIAMDDFGTGYSSLSYLQSFRFGKIKIDRSFVSDIEDGEHDASIARAAIAMGRSLGMKVVAEGVETDLQATLLARLQCDELQGYLIARPMSADDMDSFLLERGDRLAEGLDKAA